MEIILKNKNVINNICNCILYKATDYTLKIILE